MPLNKNKLGVKKVQVQPQTDITLPFKKRIQELEVELQEREETEMLKSEVLFRREILTVLNRIAIALEGSEDQAGGEPDEVFLPETPDPEPDQATSEEF